VRILAANPGQFNLERMPKPIMDFSSLTVSERIQLAFDLWDSLDEAPEVLAVTDPQREELDRRLQLHRAKPDSAIPWGSLRQELFKD
jgi:putative addiction module component (TIGR02574 family)